MSLILKILRSQENRSACQKIRQLDQEAERKNEDPEVYHVKQKLKNHPNLKYSSMSDQDLTREAIHLTQADSLKEFFSDLTHKPIQSIMEEVSHEGSRELTQRELLAVRIPQKHIERVGHLTLKLHLRHQDETPSFLTRLGAALLKIPYGVLHATLEIGDTNSPNISYMLEFNDSHLVQPRKKNVIENTALEATIPLGGARLYTSEAWPQAPTSAEMRLREKRASVKTGVGMVDKYFSSNSIPIRSRSVCVKSAYEKDHSNQANQSCPTITESDQDQGGQNSAAGFRGPCFKRSQPVVSITPLEANAPATHKDSLASKTAQHSKKIVTARRQMPHLHEETDVDIGTAEGCQPDTQGLINSLSKLEKAHNGLRLPKPYSTLPFSSNTRPHLTKTESPHQEQNTSSEDLTHLLHLSLSKILLIEKLVQIIIKYNTNYYYHNITRNCQTFIVEVLQSFGVWENFRLGERLEEYLKNLTKGKKEVYKSHKSINDRVMYLVHSGEIEETTYDDLRYLRSLYTIFHLEESTGASRASAVVVCSEPDCLLNVLEEALKKKRPEDATVLQPPENYM